MCSSRVYQMCKLYIYSPSSGLYTCPLAMTDGAAKVIQVWHKHSLASEHHILHVLNQHSIMLLINACKHFIVLTWFLTTAFLFLACKHSEWFSGCVCEVCRCFLASRWSIQSFDHPSAWAILDVWTVDDGKTGRIWCGSVLTFRVVFHEPESQRKGRQLQKCYYTILLCPSEP